MNENECVPESGDFIVYDNTYEEIIRVAANRDCVLPLYYFDVETVSSNKRNDRKSIHTYKIYQNGDVKSVDRAFLEATALQFMKREEAALHKLGNVYDASN